MAFLQGAGRAFTTRRTATNTNGANKENQRLKGAPMDSSAPGRFESGLTLALASAFGCPPRGVAPIFIIDFAQNSAVMERCSPERSSVVGAFARADETVCTRVDR